MHTHVYKAGGDWKTPEGFEYTIKAVNRAGKAKLLNDDWFTSLEDAMSIDGESTKVEDKKKLDKK